MRATDKIRFNVRSVNQFFVKEPHPLETLGQVARAQRGHVDSPTSFTHRAITNPLSACFPSINNIFWGRFQEAQAETLPEQEASS